MKDNWKNFINENSDEFNSETPRDRFFEGVAPFVKKKRQPKMVRLSFVLQMAAVIIVLFGLSFYFFFMTKENNEKQIVTDKETINDDRMILAKIDPELAETEYYYVSKIDRLMKEMDAQQLTDDVKELLEQLDKEFSLLKKEMGENINSKQIIQAMIENYRLKLKLLEKILDNYNDSNKTENEKKHTI